MQYLNPGSQHTTTRPGHSSANTFLLYGADDKPICQLQICCRLSVISSVAKETGFIINNNNNIIIIPNKQFGQISRRTHPRAHRPPHSFTTRQRLVFHSALEQLGRWLLTKACSLLMLLSEDQYGFVTAAHTPSSLAKIYPILLRLHIYICPHWQKNLWSTLQTVTHTQSFPSFK